MFWRLFEPCKFIFPLLRPLPVQNPTIIRNNDKRSIKRHQFDWWWLIKVTYLLWGVRPYPFFFILSKIRCPIWDFTSFYLHNQYQRNKNNQEGRHGLIPLCSHFVTETAKISELQLSWLGSIARSCCLYYNYWLSLIMWYSSSTELLFSCSVQL